MRLLLPYNSANTFLNSQTKTSILWPNRGRTSPPPHTDRSFRRNRLNTANLACGFLFQARLLPYCRHEGRNLQGVSKGGCSNYLHGRLHNTEISRLGFLHHVLNFRAERGKRRFTQVYPFSIVSIMAKKTKKNLRIFCWELWWGRARFKKGNSHILLRIYALRAVEK